MIRPRNGWIRNAALHRHDRLKHITRTFSTSWARLEIKDIAQLDARIHPKYLETKHNDLLSLQWPQPPRNILLTKKDNAPSITSHLVEFAKHITSSYDNISLILEPHAASEIHHELNTPVYTWGTGGSNHGEEAEDHLKLLHEKLDLISTLGGDGTILHASSLFATSARVPPILSFSMGTLGFLGEWKFHEYKRAFRETYMSGASIHTGYSPALIDQVHRQDEQQETSRDVEEAEHTSPSLTSASPAATVEESSEISNSPASNTNSPHKQTSKPTAWSSIRGKSLGRSRGARVLLRNRLQIGVYDSKGERVPTALSKKGSDVYAMNEVIIHRGSNPHLAIIEVFIGGRFLTEAVADGMIVSTPTGSTAYSLSTGGSIVHPLVSSLLLTPVCPRSLSFRPLVLPSNTPITLRLSRKNRSQELEVSIDGVRSSTGLGLGMEVRVWGENMKGSHQHHGNVIKSGDAERSGDGEWSGGVPSIVRGVVGSSADVSGEDHWVGGLNGLLKFNFPFGEQADE